MIGQRLIGVTYPSNCCRESVTERRCQTTNHPAILIGNRPTGVTCGGHKGLRGADEEHRVLPDDDVSLLALWVHPILVVTAVSREPAQEVEGGAWVSRATFSALRRSS